MAEKKEYTASQKVLDAEAALQQQKAAKPGEYVSAYEAPLQQAMDRILNREDFHYNLDGDALYRRYRNQAIRNGRLAMADAAGQAAALTGGYGNSYAQSVGQQAYNRQLDSLADRIPELYNLAMSQYQLQTQNLIEYFPFGGKHDNGSRGFCTDFPAYLVAVNTRQHQIQKNEIGLEGIKNG